MEVVALMAVGKLAEALAIPVVAAGSQRLAPEAEGAGAAREEACLAEGALAARSVGWVVVEVVADHKEEGSHRGRRGRATETGGSALRRMLVRRMLAVMAAAAAAAARDWG